MDEYKIGFSTGTLRKLGNVKDALRLLTENGYTTAVELGMGVTEPESEIWKTIEQEDLTPFEYVSLHTPKIRYSRDNEEVSVVFERIRKLHALRPLDLVVVHPDIVEDFSLFDELDVPVGIENMDHHKKKYRTVSEMRELLDTHTDYHMVLDVNHVFVNDSSMRLAEDFYDVCGGRIQEVHLSGFETLHDPLYKTKQRFIVEAIQDWSVPTIIESGMNDADEVSLEVAYIRGVLG